ncbi:hypothetical protein Tco_1458623 [Tanacetum coccineum]
MQAPLRARFRDLPTVDMKEILQQRMFEDDSYKAHTIHNDLYEALQKSLELDYSNQRLADQEEARKKRRKRRDVPRTPPGSPPSPPPPPPPLAGASGAPAAQQQGSKAPSSSKTAASTSQSMAWTTSDTRFESTDFTAAQELSPTDSLMQDDSIPDEQVHLSDDEDSGNDHLPKADSRQDWWKPLPKEERPATPEPAWTISSSNKSGTQRQKSKEESSEDFQSRRSFPTPAPAGVATASGSFPTVAIFTTASVTTPYTRRTRDSRRIIIEPSHTTSVLTISAKGKGKEKMVEFLGHVTIQPQFFFNKDLKYLRYGSKGSNHALSISKMKVASYPDFRLELLVPEQMWIDDVCTYDISAKYGISHWWFKRQKFYIDRHDSPSCRKYVRTHMRILSVIRIKAYSRYSDFEDLNLLLLQGHLDHLPGLDKRMLSTTVKLWTRNLFKHDYTIIESPRVVVFPVNNNERKIMRFNKIYKFSDGMLTRILEALDYRVKEFKVKRLNPGMNTQFWTEKDMTRSKEFIAAIERRLKTRRI